MFNNIFIAIIPNVVCISSTLMKQLLIRDSLENTLLTKLV